MDSLLVRLKPFDPRQRHTLRRFLYKGIVFFEERGWYRVSHAIGDALRGARQLDHDEYSPFAFDVCTEADANGIDAREKHDSVRRRQSTDNLPLVAARAETPRARGTNSRETRS